jgi:hypothetical protein
VSVLRVGLPVAVIIAGIVVIGVGPKALGGALIGVAVVVSILNAIIRLGFNSQADRDREEQARRTFTRTGRWPSR